MYLKTKQIKKRQLLILGVGVVQDRKSNHSLLQSYSHNNVNIECYSNTVIM